VRQPDLVDALRDLMRWSGRMSAIFRVSLSWRLFVVNLGLRWKIERQRQRGA
jgi:hypothetical protein